MKNLILGLALTLSFNSFAKTLRGGHDGGGGQGVVCYDEGRIASVRLLDTFEGEMLEGLKPDSFTGTAEEIFMSVVKKYPWYFNNWGGEKGLRNFHKSFRFLPSGTRLKLIEDSNAIFIPENCKVEQLVNFQGQNRIFVVSDFWEKMSFTDQAALYLHELIWYFERSNGVSYSARARRTVARMMSDNFIVSAPKQAPRGAFTCQTIDTENQSIIHNFWLDEEERSLRFTHINREISFTHHKIGLGEDQFEELMKLLEYPSSPSHLMEMVNWPLPVVSELDGVNSHIMFLNWKKEEGKLFLTTKNLEFPGLDFQNEHFICFREAGTWGSK